MIGLRVKESGVIVHASAVSGVGGMKLGRDWMGCLPIEYDNSIEKIF